MSRLRQGEYGFLRLLILFRGGLSERGRFDNGFLLILSLFRGGLGERGQFDRDFLLLLSLFRTVLVRADAAIFESSS